MIKSFITSLILTLAIVISPMSIAQPDPNMQHVEVNINTAEAEELEKSLDGIGKAKSQAIVDYREENGLFKSIDSLSHVKGIGDATLDKNRSRIVL